MITNVLPSRFRLSYVPFVVGFFVAFITAAAAAICCVEIGVLYYSVCVVWLMLMSAVFVHRALSLLVCLCLLCCDHCWTHRWS